MSFTPTNRPVDFAFGAREQGHRGRQNKPDAVTLKLSALLTDYLCLNL